MHLIYTRPSLDVLTSVLHLTFRQRHPQPIHMDEVAHENAQRHRQLSCHVYAS
jgi:hypothetical protein